MSKSHISFPFIVMRRPLFGNFRSDCSAIEAAFLMSHQKIKIFFKQTTKVLKSLYRRTIHISYFFYKICITAPKILVSKLN